MVYVCFRPETDTWRPPPTERNHCEPGLAHKTASDWGRTVRLALSAVGGCRYRTVGDGARPAIAIGP